jgi:3-hydroxyacyl-[acyl-carrier-protein] dehydratase
VAEAADNKVIFDIREIQSILSHRYPFLLIDRVVEFEPNQRIVAIKNVTFNEPFFPGHFPELPVMPGVLILEAMAQTGAVMAIRSPDGVGPGKHIFLVGANEVRWRKQVTPGDTLRIEMTSYKKKRPFWVMNGRVTVEGKLVAEATISAAEA